MQYAKFSVNPRRWRRAAVQLPAQYFIKGQSSRYMDCTIMTISRSGAGILFPGKELLKPKSSIFFEFVVPNTFEQLTIKGELRNKNRHRDGCIGGVAFTSLLPENTFSRLA